MQYINECLQRLLTDIRNFIYAQSIILNKQEVVDLWLNSGQTVLKTLGNSIEDLKISRENHQAAIEVVRSKIDIMNSRANIATQEQIKHLMEVNTEMQKQSLIFQYAAALIEFIVLAYYSYALWKMAFPGFYHIVPGWLQLLLSVILSANTVYLTHLLAEWAQGGKHVKKLIFSLVLLLFIITGIIMAGITLTGSHA